MPTTTTNPAPQTNEPPPVLNYKTVVPDSATPPKRRVHVRELSILISVTVAVAIFAAIKPEFRSWGAALSVLQGASTDGLMVVGMTIVIVCGAFDMSVGSTMAGGGLVAAVLIKYCGFPVWAAVPLALASGALVGLANGLVITRLKINPFITTLGTMSIIRGIVQVSTKTYYPTGFPASFKQIAWAEPLGIPLPVIILVVVTVLADLAMRHLRYLRQVYFIGSNETAAVLTGIPVRGVKTFAFVLTGALAAMAGVIVTAKANAIDPNGGISAELRVISAVIVGGASLSGGRGTILGSFLGLLLMQVINTGLVFVDMPPESQLIAVGLVLIVAAMIDQAGTSFGKGLFALLTQTRSKKVERVINVVLAVALLASVGLWLTGGGRSASGGATRRKQKYVAIAAVPGHPYWVDSRAGLEDKARELGITATFIGPPTIDVNAQIDYVNKAIAEGVDGIIMIPMNDEGCTPAINRAIESGIPVLCADADAPSSKRYSFVGTGNFKAGVRGGEELAKLLHGQGKVALIAIPGAAHLKKRIDGYMEAFKAYPGIEVIATLSDQGGSSEAEKNARALLQAHPDVAGFGCVDAAGGEGAAVAVKEAGKTGQIKIVAMDRNEATLNFIEEGVIDMSVGQRTYTMTYLALQMLYDIRNGKVKLVDDWQHVGINPLPPEVDTGNFLITRDNVRAFYHSSAAQPEKP